MAAETVMGLLKSPLTLTPEKSYFLSATCLEYGSKHLHLVTDQVDRPSSMQ